MRHSKNDIIRIIFIVVLFIATWFSPVRDPLRGIAFLSLGFGILLYVSLNMLAIVYKARKKILLKFYIWKSRLHARPQSKK